MRSLSCLLFFLLIIPGVSAQEQENYNLQPIHTLWMNQEYRDLLQETDPDKFESREVFSDSLLSRILYFRGTAYQELSILDSALLSYTEAKNLYPENPVFLKAIGQTLHRLGRIREAIGYYQKVTELRPDDKKSLADLGGLYSLNRKYRESLNVYKYLLESDSLNYYFLKQAGKCYMELNQADSALLHFKAAFERNPADVFLTQQITNIYLKKKDLESAIFNLQKGFIYDTSNIDLLKLRGYLWLLLGKYEMAIWDLEDAREQDSISLFIQRYLGLSYHEEKRFKEARESLLIAFSLDSTDAEIAYFLGSSCRWGGYEEDGILYYEKSLELQQPDPGEMKNIYIQMAELYKVLHRFDEALAAYLKASEYDPLDNVVDFKIGQMYDRNLYQKKTAIKYYEQYLSKGKTDQQLFDTSEGSSESLKEHVKARIIELKEELFFENQL